MTRPHAIALAATVALAGLLVAAVGIWLHHATAPVEFGGLTR